MLTCQRAARLLSGAPVNASPEPVNAVAQPVNKKPKSKDWHKPGYMAEYMRKYRALKKARKAA